MLSDINICHHHIARGTGLEFSKAWFHSEPDSHVLVLSGFLSCVDAIRTLPEGAFVGASSPSDDARCRFYCNHDVFEAALLDTLLNNGISLAFFPGTMTRETMRFT